jgi:peptide-methionine (R)-S-oxide reductase
MISRRTLGQLGLAVSAVALTARIAPASASAPAKSFPITKTADEWKKVLTSQQYYVLREHGTERPFTSPLDKSYEAGTYHCAGCDTALFASTTKYDSRTGWPSFWKPLDNAIGTTTDASFLMVRTEVHCINCGGHLGHVFEDGPKPTGLRYCMNGVAMKFVPAEKPKS